MVSGIFHEGSGLGDQLFRYITMRTLAEEKGINWGIKNYESFKGKEFFKNFAYASDGLLAEIPEVLVGYKEWNEKEIRDAEGNDIRSYDPEINFIEDNTIIDGSFEDYKYWGHNLENINKWLAVKPLDVPDDLCVIGFRGGEYASNPDLFLTPEYYEEATETMLLNAVKDFEIHTDDPVLAKKYVPIPLVARSMNVIDNQPISHSKHSNMAFNWRSTRYAKYAIIPNSAFFIIPRLLKHFEDPEAITIAPRWWARRNTKGPWRPAAYYKQFQYI